MIQHSRTTNLKLPFTLSYKSIAISLIALLTTCQSTIAADNLDYSLSSKSTFRLSTDYSPPALNLDDLTTTSVVTDLLNTGMDTNLPITDSIDNESIDFSTWAQTDFNDSRSSIFSLDYEAKSNLSWDDIPTVRILSLDGGGVRGIMEARFIQKLTEQTGKTVPEMFHLVAGTSAGGLLTGAYTLPDGQGDPKKSPPLYSSDFIFKLMLERTKHLFQKKHSFGGLFGPRYKSEPVDDFMNEFFGDATFERTTSDALITTFNLIANRPKIFKSWDHREIFYTKDILGATSAAPTYFPPRHIYPVGKTFKTDLGYTLSDGGTCANNPTACALADARKLYPEATHYQIVSLGAGNSTRPLHYTKMKKAGLVGWGSNLIDIFMNGQSAHTDYLMDTLFTPDEYSRWNPTIAAENASLDNTTDNNLRELVQAEDDLITSRRGEFDRLAAKLTTPKSDLTPTYATRRL